MGRWSERVGRDEGQTSRNPVATEDFLEGDSARLILVPLLKSLAISQSRKYKHSRAIPNCFSRMNGGLNTNSRRNKQTNNHRQLLLLLSRRTIHSTIRFV